MFRLEGKLKNINKGEFYVYSTDGSLGGVDTIRVDKGRFVYRTECNLPATLHIVFPNFSIQPLFIEPGGRATMRGDVTNMKELEVKGTDDNEAMTAYRLQVAHASPPDVARLTRKFIEDHTSSAVALHLLRQHYIDTSKPDYELASRLLVMIGKAQPHNKEASELAKHLRQIRSTAEGKSLPAFSMPLLTGGKADKALLGQGKSVIMAFAMWSNESLTMLRRLSYMLKNGKASFNLLVVSLDGSSSDVRQLMGGETFRGWYACPALMFDDLAVKALGLRTVPDNIVVHSGRIVRRSLPLEKLEKYLKGEEGSRPPTLS